jgi:hypothetical protein
MSGCDMATDMGNMMDKMNKVNEELKSELNLDAQVGWNIHNGTLTQITVLITADSAGERTVQELKNLTYPIVKKHFKTSPKVFQLAVTFPIEPQS